MKEIYHRLIILGCGASGMVAAISAAQYEKDLLILERNDVPGKKITATGNGKCNFTNLNISEKDYFSSSGKPYPIYELFDNQDTLKFFRKLGIIPFIRNGYCYPHSNQATAIRDALYYKTLQLGVKTEFNSRVTSIEKKNGLFYLKCGEIFYTCHKLIIASGGQSQRCFGTDGSLYYMCRKLGHSIVEPAPALVGLKTDEECFSELTGVRAEAGIKLIINNQEMYSEIGEIVFSQKGISGIPVMNCSRFVSTVYPSAFENTSASKFQKISSSTIENKRTSQISLIIDFLTEETKESIEEHLLNSYKDSKLPLAETVNGIINNKLTQVILKKANVSPKYNKHDNTTYDVINRIASLIKGFEFSINGTLDFEASQCTAGGIPLYEINNTTLESNCCKDLFFTGELLDVDGKCGGYNLQWAWTTGVIAGACACGGQFDKNKLIKT